MAAYNKFQTFVGDLGLKVHNLNTDTCKVYLTNAAPSASLDNVLADLADISAGNGYTAGGKDATNLYSEAAGTGTLTGTDIVWTASGGTIGPFRYATFYNDTPTSPADPLISWWDYGSSITLADGETFTVDFGASIFTLT
tara:strand:+ start:2466 stop:2885 length:420 start_codon:yes stop_codon:yes gene_type:complete